MAQRVSFESALTPSQETVAPAMSHRDMDAKVLCNRAEWAAIPQRFGLPQPFLPLVQPGERRAAQSVERPPASTSRLCARRAKKSAPACARPEPACWRTGCSNCPGEWGLPPLARKEITFKA